MNGFPQLIRALVMESVALVLLFWLAFHQQLQPSPDADAPKGPPPLVIRTAPAQLADATLQKTQRKIESAAQRAYETAFRVAKPERAPAQRSAQKHPVAERLSQRMWQLTSSPVAAPLAQNSTTLRRPKPMQLRR